MSTGIVKLGGEPVELRALPEIASLDFVRELPDRFGRTTFPIQPLHNTGVPQPPPRFTRDPALLPFVAGAAATRGSPIEDPPVAIEELRRKYSAQVIDHDHVLAQPGGYKTLAADLERLGEGTEKWPLASLLEGVVTDSVRFQLLRGLPAGVFSKFMVLQGQLRLEPKLGDSVEEIGKIISGMSPAAAAIAIDYLPRTVQGLVRDLDFLEHQKGGWLYRDPLADVTPIVDAGRIQHIAAPHSPGNAAYAKDGSLFTTMHSAGRNQPAPPYHLGKVDPATGRIEPYPSAEVQSNFGGLLGIHVIPKPAALGGEAAGELLLTLDWKKSQLFAFDLTTNEEIRRFDLPKSRAPKPAQALFSFHNDLAVDFRSNPDGTFFISNPPGKYIGVFKPNWDDPSASSFTKVLEDQPVTRGGNVQVPVNGKVVKLELFKLLGIDVEVPFRHGVDSIAFTPDLMGAGPHILFTPLTPSGAGKLMAFPSSLADAADPKGAFLSAMAQGTVRPIARIPGDDGLNVITVRGRNLLFGADRAGGGAFVLDLSTMRLLPLMRDRGRINWADGVGLHVEGDTLRVAVSNSGLDKSLEGDPPTAATRGLYTVEIGLDELFAALDAAPAPSIHDHL